MRRRAQLFPIDVRRTVGFRDVPTGPPPMRWGQRALLVAFWLAVAVAAVAALKF